MPRLTDAAFLAQRHLLVEMWNSDWKPLTMLPSFAQRNLHRFYAMTKDLSEKAALLHRQEATLREPSLPQQAGRAFVQLERITKALQEHTRPVAAATISPQSGHKRSRGAVRVRALARPEIDFELLAKALMEHARHMERLDDGNSLPLL